MISEDPTQEKEISLAMLLHLLLVDCAGVSKLALTGQNEQQATAPAAQELFFQAIDKLVCSDDETLSMNGGLVLTTVTNCQMCLMMAQVCHTLILKKLFPIARDALVGSAYQNLVLWNHPPDGGAQFPAAEHVQAFKTFKAQDQDLQMDKVSAMIVAQTVSGTRVSLGQLSRNYLEACKHV